MIMEQSEKPSWEFAQELGCQMVQDLVFCKILCVCANYVQLAEFWWG